MCDKANKNESIIGLKHPSNIGKTPEYYVNGIEQHLLAGRIQLLQSRGCSGREIGQFSTTRIFDNATRVGIKCVGDAALHLRHIVFTESVSFTQMDLQTLLSRKPQSAFRLRTPFLKNNTVHHFFFN